MSPLQSGPRHPRRRFLALGDSYTVGEGIASAACWPAGLAHALRNGGVPIDDPQVIATTGWTTDELAAAMDAATFEPPYALVTLLIGVNDQYRGREGADYRPRFRALVGRAVALADDAAHRVLVVSIPDWGVTRYAREQQRDPAAVARAIDAFNAVAREEAARAGARFVDITGISRRCGCAPDMLAPDGLHPSAAQYALWLRRLLPASRAVLSPRPPS